MSYHARVGRLAGARDRLEVQTVTNDLNQHEVKVGVETLRDELGRPSVASTKRSGAARNEIQHALLRSHPLVQVLVTGEDDVDAVIDEHLLELPAYQSGVQPVTTRRVERMVK